MKVNILINQPGDVRSGYLNIDPAAPAACEDGRVNGDPADLSSLVEAGECEELVALDILDAFPAHQVDAALDHFISRLAHGGSLALSVIDLREVCRAYLANKISLDQANALLHGETLPRRCSLTMDRLLDTLDGKGLNIVTKRFENFRAVVVAERP